MVVSNIFFIFIPTWGNKQFWLTFFKVVETTNYIGMKNCRVIFCWEFLFFRTSLKNHQLWYKTYHLFWISRSLGPWKFMACHTVVTPEKNHLKTTNAKDLPQILVDTQHNSSTRKKHTQKNLQKPPWGMATHWFLWCLIGTNQRKFSWETSDIRTTSQSS